MTPPPQKVEFLFAFFSDFHCDFSIAKKENGFNTKITLTITHAGIIIQKNSFNFSYRFPNHFQRNWLVAPKAFQLYHFLDSIHGLEISCTAQNVIWTPDEQRSLRKWQLGAREAVAPLGTSSRVAASQQNSWRECALNVAKTAFERKQYISHASWLYIEEDKSHFWHPLSHSLHPPT